GGVAGHFVDVDDPVGGEVEDAHLAGEGDVLGHGAAEERDAAAGGDGFAGDLLDPVEVGGERGDDEAPFGVVADEVAHGDPDGGFGGGEAGPFGVGGVGEEQQYAVSAELAEPGDVGASPVD